MIGPIALPLDRTLKVYVAGHRGLVGSAILRNLESNGFTNVLTRASSELDLTDRTATLDFFRAEAPQVVFMAAAKVGGILANSERPVEFISQNLQIQVNLMDAALAVRVKWLLFLGSSCIYPKLTTQPIREEYLLSGHLEPTNDAYAIAKIAGIVQVQAVRRQYGLPWISAMPTNLYGPGDNFSPKESHVLPALIARYVEAVEAGKASVTNWGTGSPHRELLHVDDLAAACLHLLEHYDGQSHVNVGVGYDVSVADIAGIVGQAVGYNGEVFWDTTRPDGTPRKLLDSSLLRATGWLPRIQLRPGIESTVEWFRNHRAEARR